MSEETRQDPSGSEGNSKKPRQLSRRAVLKGSIATMPAVLTLQSGAALARSSNILGATYSPSTDRRGRTLCLDTRSVYPVRGTRRSYDLGEPAKARVFAINENDYRALPRLDAPKVSEAQACLEDRTVYYVDRRQSWTGAWESSDSDGEEDGLSYVYHRNWKRARVPRGVFVSATALSSFSGKIYFHNIG